MDEPPSPVFLHWVGMYPLAEVHHRCYLVLMPLTNTETLVLTTYGSSLWTLDPHQPSRPDQLRDVELGGICSSILPLNKVADIVEMIGDEFPRGWNVFLDETGRMTITGDFAGWSIH